MYKELMQMGFITLFIQLFTAAEPKSLFAKYIIEIDFVGYVIFFVAIFLPLALPLRVVLAPLFLFLVAFSRERAISTMKQI
jgi:hypothetical protein